MTKLLQNAGIYILHNRDNGKCYVGKDTALGMRAKQHLTLKETGCHAIHNAIKKHGADAFDLKLIPYPNISDKALCEVEKWKIRQFRSHRSQGGYNLTLGGEGGFDSETVRKANRKRVEAGTHNFQDSEFQRKQNRKRVADGTHHFFDKEIQRKRIKSVRESNRKRIADGTHHFLDPQFHRKGRYAHKIKAKNRRRKFYRWVSVVLTAKSVCEDRIYRNRTREGYFDADIPDTSKSEQLDLF